MKSLGRGVNLEVLYGTLSVELGPAINATRRGQKESGHRKLFSTGSRVSGMVAL